MSLGIALNNAVSGLRINQESLSVLSQNIANVNTDGYSREVVQQSAIVLGGKGEGVRLDDVTRKIDTYLQRSVQNQGSANNMAQVVSGYYERIQVFLGQPGASNSIDTSITTFFNTLQTLANAPETVSYKSNVVQSGQQLAGQISNLAQQMQDLRFQADQDISDSVKTINTNIDKLEKLNVAIATAKALGHSTANEEDQRDQALRSIANLMDISVTYDNQGAVNVVSGNGVALVETGATHRLRYTPVQSSTALSNDAPLNPIEMVSTGANGVTTVNSVPLVSGGTSGNIKSGITGGSIAGLLQVRDQTIPEVLNQLDMLASRVRDSVNTVQNQGVSYPPPNSLTGERLLDPNASYEWTGDVRIAVLQADGTPVPSGYADETGTGIRPLTLDLGSLDAGQGAGKPTLQSIINEINNHFGAPGNKAEVGNLNNIQLVSDTNVLPSGGPDLFNFDFDNENISRNDASFFVNGMTVLDDTGTNITSVTQSPPTFSLSTTSTYQTSLGSPDVTITGSSLSGIAAGDTIYLGGPSVANVDGIPSSSLTGYFTVKSISGNQVVVTSNPPVNAATGATVSDPAPGNLTPAYDTVAAGVQQRSNGKNGSLQVDLSANSSSAYYDISANVSVVDKTTGAVSTSTVTYRVYNNAHNLQNTRYDATAVSAGGTLVPPGTSQASLRAIMVDANGNELPKFNGQYLGSGYLKIVGGNGGNSTTTTAYSVAIDEMDSKQLGNPSASPTEPGTGWGFSHYFGLNNFFKENSPNLTGDTLKNSALNLAVEDRLVSNPNQVATASLVQQKQPADATKAAQYTYLIYSGDNTNVSKLAKLSSATVSFDQAGGLPNTEVTLQSYASNFLGYTSSNTNAAADTATNAKALYDGFVSRQQAVTGVNLDEELANTITYQNAYSATARVVSVVNQMYDALIQAV